MIRAVLLDTGPLVAGLNRRDHFHEWARAQLAVVAPPLLTCEAVLAEACYLLRVVTGGSDRVLEMVERGIVCVPYQTVHDVAALRSLMSKYADMGMSLADACLVRMCEQDPSSIVMTLDSDFRTYRRHGKQPIPLLMPPGL